MMALQEFVLWRPQGRLGELVPYVTGYRESGLAPGLHRGLPSPYLTVIVTLDEPCEITQHPDPAQPGDSFDTLIGGLHTTPALIRHDGAQSGVQLSLSPLGARALLGVPAGHLAARDLHGDGVLGAWAGRLRDQLGTAGGWRQRFSTLESFLTRRLADVEARGGRASSGGVGAEVEQAWRLLERTRGGLSIGELAREVGYGPRHLGELFRREIGLSPKQAARVIRFDAVRRAMPRALQTGRIAQLAASAGYADQAHLNREFLGFAGVSPRRWYAEELRNVQAAPACRG